MKKRIDKTAWGDEAGYDSGECKGIEFLNGKCLLCGIDHSSEGSSSSVSEPSSEPQTEDYWAWHEEFQEKWLSNGGEELHADPKQMENWIENLLASELAKERGELRDIVLKAYRDENENEDRIHNGALDLIIARLEKSNNKKSKLVRGRDK